MLFTPYQKKMLKGFGAGAMPNADDEDIARRTKIMESGGPLQVRLRKPADVHTLYGDYGTEAVCHATIWEPRKLLTSFGKLPGIDSLRDKITSGSSAPFYAVYDMSDFARHIIWAEPTEDKYYLPDISSGELSEGGLLFMNQKNDLPFINWVCRISGSPNDEDVEDQRIPMLYTVDKADQFNIQNIVQTLVLSEAIRTAAAPRGFRSGPGADKMDVDYGDPAQDIVGKTGQTYMRLPPPELDRALFELSNWITTNVEKSTVPRVLQGGNVPSQTFSTLNLTVQSGMQVVEPYKQLAERWLEDAARLALKWVAYDKKALSAIAPDDGISEGGEVAKRVKTFVLDPTKFDADALIIAAELEPDLPVDRTARINGARMLQEMGMPARVSWEELGEKDATGLQREARFEQLERFFFERFMNQIKMSDELAMQQKSQAMQMEMQMAAQQAMQQQQAPPPPQPTAAPPAEPPPWAAQGVGPTGQEPVPGTPPGMEGIEGQGWNPSQGGTPPSQANPEATFEGQTGTSRGGQEIV